MTPILTRLLLALFKKPVIGKLLNISPEKDLIKVTTTRKIITLTKKDLQEGYTWKHVNVLTHNQLSKLPETVFLKLLDNLHHIDYKNMLIDAYYKTLTGYINYIKLTSPKLSNYADIKHIAEIYKAQQEQNKITNHELII